MTELNMLDFFETSPYNILKRFYSLKREHHHNTRWRMVVLLWYCWSLVEREETEKEQRDLLKTYSRGRQAWESYFDFPWNPVLQLFCNGHFSLTHRRCVCPPLSQ